MDTQLRRGLLDVCVLSAIKDQDSYGYKIIKDLDPILKLSESTLYTILKRLEDGGLITVRVTMFMGRVRKYYHITASGHARLEQFKSEWKELMQVYKYIEDKQ